MNDARAKKIFQLSLRINDALLDVAVLQAEEEKGLAHNTYYFADETVSRLAVANMNKAIISLASARDNLQKASENK